MNRQEVFNTVATHLLTQKRKATHSLSQSNGAPCAYLNEIGDRCAIGCMIPKGHKGQRFSGTVHSLLDDYPDLRLLWNVETQADISYLRDLQIIHDANLVKKWKSELKRVGNQYDLNVSALETL